MSTNIVSFILLNQCRNGVKMAALVTKFDSLLLDLKGRELGFSGSSIEVINSAVSFFFFKNRVFFNY